MRTQRRAPIQAASHVTQVEIVEISGLIGEEQKEGPEQMYWARMVRLGVDGNAHLGMLGMRHSPPYLKPHSAGRRSENVPSRVTTAFHMYYLNSQRLGRTAW
jgi:hypothetical protein